MPISSGVRAKAVAIEAKPDADEEHAHHALAAPLVRDPAGRQREHAEREEPGCCVFQEVGIAQAPLAVQRQRRHGGEDQREQVVQEVSEVEQQEVQAVAHEGSPWPDVGRPCATQTSAFALPGKPGREHSWIDAAVA